MTSDTDVPRLRLWPGVVLVIFQWGVRFGVPLYDPDAAAYAMLGAVLGWLLFAVWWGVFSRAPGRDRVLGVAAMLGSMIATRFLLHESMALAGMGILYFVYVTPPLTLAFLIWAAVFYGRPKPLRSAAFAAAILLPCIVWTFVRTGGVSMAGDTHFAWRWSETAEDRLLAEAEDERLVVETETLGIDAGSTPEWPGFRGPGRDGRVPGVRIATDLETSPPTELWRRAIGPGWSSFAVHGKVFYTQEQRGEEELVSCYLVDTGEPVWRHAEATRFWEANGGAGPRATPTLADGRVYALGANGTLCVLEAADGSLVWRRDVVADSGVPVPIWGYSGSPLVLGDLVVVAAVGTLVAYDRTSGEQRWTGPEGGIGYSSPHFATLDGVDQILLASKTGLVSVASSDGATLWIYDWPGRGRIVQPTVLPSGDLLLSRGETTGLRRLSVARANGAWTIEEIWTTKRLKPYYSDLVIHDGHAYGLDGSILAAIDLETGDRAWKGGRYGAGQILLIEDQSLILGVGEKGDLFLVEATPEERRELASVSVLDGKTWNHPVLVDDVLLVRNAEEVAAFRLARADSAD